jgi:farnesyl diphosphate synthase
MCPNGLTRHGHDIKPRKVDIVMARPNPAVSPTFEHQLEVVAQAVASRLSLHLQPTGPTYHGCVSTPPDRLTAAMQHAVLGGGKRFRPFLVIESAAMFGLEPEEALDTAAALECLHCYSLVHDDLPAMDNDDLRRGRPTVHKAYDDWTAILAGDGLLTLAFDILARPSTHPDAAVRAELVLALARAGGAGGMVGGQSYDLEADKLGLPTTTTTAHIRRLQAMKTGALITFAVEAGAILGKATCEERDALKSYGDHLGFAFQIADDLLDAEGDAATVGKAVGKDSAAGKATLVSLMGLDAARAKLAQTERNAIAALAPFGARAQTLTAAARFVVTRQN